jgi:hypothetical protein
VSLPERWRNGIRSGIVNPRLFPEEINCYNNNNVGAQIFKSAGFIWNFYNMDYWYIDDILHNPLAHDATVKDIFDATILQEQILSTGNLKILV